MTTDAHRHARLGSLAALRETIVAGINVNAKDEFGATPLHSAIAEKQVGAAALLLELGADPRVQDNDGSTPVHYAVEHKLPSVVQTLLAVCPDAVSISDKHGNQPLWTAAFNARGEYELVSILLSFGADPNHRNKVDLAPIDIPKRKRETALLDLLEARRPGGPA